MNQIQRSESSIQADVLEACTTPTSILYICSTQTDTDKRNHESRAPFYATSAFSTYDGNQGAIVQCHAINFA